MATQKKLASGSWRVRVYDYTDEDGKKIYRSFTAVIKKECAFIAAEFSRNKDRLKCKRSSDVCFICFRSGASDPCNIAKENSIKTLYAF